MDGLLPTLIAIGAFVLGFAVATAIGKNRSTPSTPSGSNSPDESKSANKNKKDQARNEASRKMVEKATGSMLDILRQIAVAIKALDGAANRSNTNLTTVRNRIDDLPDMPDNLRQYQDTIIQEIDRVLHDNNELRSELSKSQQELSKQKKVIDVLQHEVHTDRLTQVANRLSFDEHSDQCFTRFEATGNPFCMLLADVDHFKKINDTHGHIIGDRVLEAIAGKLRLCLRSTDYIARYGGEEFVVILEKMELRAACKVAEELRNAIEITVFSVEGKQLRLTISIGCAQVIKGDTRSTLVKRADDEMYNAKSAGRNRVYPRLLDS